MPTNEKTNPEENPKFRYSGQYKMTWTNEAIDSWFDEMYKKYDPKEKIYCKYCGKELKRHSGHGVTTMCRECYLGIRGLRNNKHKHDFDER